MQNLFVVRWRVLLSVMSLAMGWIGSPHQGVASTEILGSEGVPQKDLLTKVGRLLMIGFHGTDPNDPAVRRVLRQAENGEIGGVIFFGRNIKNPDQVCKLTAAFRSARTPHPLLIGVDQEGGKVQRLNSRNGFQDFLSAKKVAESYSAEKAYEYYVPMARMIKEAGFNLVFAPVVDLNPSPESGQRLNPAIGYFERSYSDDPERVVDYAGALIRACRAQNLLTVLKHFPGHGRAPTDSHRGWVDITNTACEEEQKPFRKLIEKGEADLVMTAHLFNKKWDQADPVTVSSIIVQDLLRKKAQYNGVIITDDLYMGAISQNYALKEVMVRALKAGHDILLLSDNQAAASSLPRSQRTLPSEKEAEKVGGDPPQDLALLFRETIKAAVQNQEMSLLQLQGSCHRVEALIQKLQGF